ncbi:BT4734/BF3469 family protein [Flavisolibacter ginsengisoli]|jgi:hypothetical protein|uniref:HTH domain-containing protein n=1 Tax=Flavisolibacter ginsengisoli DSM 18119 TaxID=1121884 RepID=A0A1M5CG95_9BACT|nr:BT4734/BF3469 family protein [Flavisolibacter ginsengisoli]SHF53720.1 HTH domain-containing protein [Flavisolibacter ginsengisoli DSM 18119]
MFGYYDNLKQQRKSKVIDITSLYGIIKDHPSKEKILKLHRLNKGTPEYNSLKLQLPCITAPSICNQTKDYNDIIMMSGYLYYDLDDVYDLSDTIGNLVTLHGDKITLACMSVGGKGISFYVKCNGLTKENYPLVFTALTSEFDGFNLDSKCSNPNRVHILPYDPNAYFNPDASIELSSLTSGKNKLSYRLTTYECSQPNTEGKNDQRFTLVPLDELMPKVKWESYCYHGPDDFEIKEIDYCKLLYPEKRIPNGKKRTTFTRLVITFCYCNPQLDFDHVLSFINLVNNDRTEERMVFLEMVRLVRSVVAGFRSGKLQVPTRKKFVHISKAFLGNKKALANQVNGLVKESRSRRRIRAIMELLEQAGENINPTSIGKYTGLSRSTIYRNINKEPGIDVPDIVFDSILKELRNEI